MRYNFAGVENLIKRWSRQLIVRRYPLAEIIDCEFKVGTPTEDIFCGVVKPVTSRLVASLPGDWTECEAAVLTTSDFYSTEEGGDYSDFIVYQEKEYKIKMKMHNTIGCVKIYGICSHKHDDMRAT